MRTDCTTPALPVVGCPTDAVPGAASPTPSPTTSTTAPPDQAAQQQPAAPAQPEPVLTAAPAPVAAVAPVVAGVGPAPVPTQAPAVQLATPVLSTAPTTQAVAPVATTAPLSTAVSSAYGIVVFGVIGLALLVSFLSGLRPATSTPAPPPGGTVRTQRTRLWAGLAAIAAAALVGGVGWYRISGEPLLNRQIPFLASAGIAVVVLAVLGGALVVAEQLRGDQHRIAELESAVRALTDALSPLVEDPARRASASPASSRKQRSDALVQ